MEGNERLPMLFIVNPVSGKKAIFKEIGEALQVFSNGGMAPTVIFTQKRGDATHLAEEYGGKVPLVCCSGGDGTLNEVVSGLISGGHRPETAYIPCGSTNDFAISRGLSSGIADEAANIVSGRVREYDVGCFGNRYFTYVAAFGAFCKLSYTTDQNLKNVFGHTAYLLGGVKDLSNIKPVHMKITANDTVYEDDYIFGAISNSTSVGGTVSLPGNLVNTADGLFEIILIKMPRSIAELGEIVIALLSQNYDCPLITFAQADKMTVESSVPYEWALDGEASEPCVRTEIVVLPKALKLRG